MDWDLLFIVVTAFVAIAAVVVVVGTQFTNRAQINRRLVTASGPADATTKVEAPSIGARMVRQVDEEQLGVGGDMRRRLRRDLVRAGYFSAEAVKSYVVTRIAFIIFLPLSTLLLAQWFAPIFYPNRSQLIVLISVAGAVLMATMGPGVYLSRRQRKLVREYRGIFPDMLDLIIVCVGAGLSIEASIDRVRPQLSKRSPCLGLNLELLSAQMRAGRSTVEALNSLSDRLALDEAASLVTVLRHSVELGADVTESLRVFSDEMRDKRILRAEETANAVPTKMSIPLILGIFPVIMVILVAPAVLRVSSVFQQMGHH